MAYMNQEKKAKIAAELKKIMPKDWKYSLAVRNHSTIVLTISQAPIDLLATKDECRQNGREGHRDLNHYHLSQFYDGELLETFTRIVKVLNTDNYDNSDYMSDYVNVGHYVDLNIGRWDKPFICTSAQPIAA